MNYNSSAVFHPNGQFMFYCERRRAEWYLKKNLAEVISTNDSRLEVKLLFEPKGIGPNDEFSSHEIIHRCVVCASFNDLTKHHIVPSCYRKFFPKEYKSRINHDVVIVCEYHHHVYEDLANIVKEHLALRYHVPTLQECSELQSASSNPLLKKLNVTRSLLKTYFQQLEKDKVSDKLLEKMKIIGIDVEKTHHTSLCEMLQHAEDQIDSVMDVSIDVEHGQLIVSKLENIDAFIKMWRKHFIETMDPQYMPTGWSVGYKTKMIN